MTKKAPDPNEPPVKLSAPEKRKILKEFDALSENIPNTPEEQLVHQTAVSMGLTKEEVHAAVNDRRLKESQ